MEDLKKNPAHLTQKSKRKETSLARRQGGESRRLSTGRLGGWSARGHNLCSLEAVWLIRVQVLIAHASPQLISHADQDEQNQHREADEQQQVELGFSEVEHGSARMSGLMVERVGLGSFALGRAMQRAQLLTSRPPRFAGLACRKFADRGRSDAGLRRDLGLADA